MGLFNRKATKVILNPLLEKNRKFLMVNLIIFAILVLSVGNPFKFLLYIMENPIAAVFFGIAIYQGIKLLVPQILKFKKQAQKVIIYILIVLNIILLIILVVNILFALLSV